MKVMAIDLDKIHPSPTQPRKYFDPKGLQELAESIQTYGLLQPIVVATQEEGYQILAGERRYRASKIAGLKKINCIIRSIEDFEAIALIENLQREDLNSLEKARAIEAFIRSKNLTQEEAATKLSKTRSYVANLLRLLTLDQETSQMMTRGQLTEGHARALLSLKAEKERQQLAQRIIQEGLSVRDTEKITRSHKKKSQSNGDDLEAVLERDAAEQLSQHLEAKVIIQKKGKGGKIEIDYYSKEHLIDIFDRLLGNLEGENHDIF